MMRGKSTPKPPRSGSSTPPPRDPSLLDADQFLSGEDLDELWEWFHTAHADNIDPELVFVKLINSARNPYRQQLPQGYQRRQPAAQDLISLDHEDEVGELKTLVTGLQATIAAQEQHISTLTLRDERTRESEKQLVRDLSAADARIQVLLAAEQTFEARIAQAHDALSACKAELHTQQSETNALLAKRDELSSLLEALAREQLHTATLYRDSLASSAHALDLQTQETHTRDLRIAHLETLLTAAETSAQELGNEYARRLAEKDREVEAGQGALEELRGEVEAAERAAAGGVAEAGERAAEERRGLVERVVRGLKGKGLTPAGVGLVGEEWDEEGVVKPVAQRTSWIWRS